MGVSFRTGQAAVAIASLVLLGACGDKDFENIVIVQPVATALTVVDGSDAQTAIVGTALPNPIAVRVTDQNGNALAGALVTFAVTNNNGGTLSAATATSDVNGIASTVWTLGPIAGVDSLTASLGNGASVVLTATGTAAAFANLVLISGDGQSVLAGTPTAPMVVKAVDANGNAIAGATVTWTASAGTLNNATVTTGADGTAAVILTTDILPGAYTVTATSGASTITFTGSGT
jgi:hypothetical protein